TQTDAVVIPSEAVQVGQEGPHVFVVKPDKTVEVRAVTIGATNEGEAVIAKGLVPGEQIVREGQFLLGPGSRIEIRGSASVVEEQSKDEGRRSRGAGETKDEARRERGGADRVGVAGEVSESSQAAGATKSATSQRRKSQERRKSADQGMAKPNQEGDAP
ncbi:MAG: hypothetical protein ACREQV_13360, partial [Candidatus Binatia bacterium]